MFMYVLQVRSLPSRDGQAPAQLVADLITLAPALIVLEATGGFEITVTAALASAGLPLAVAGQDRQLPDAGVSNVGERLKCW